MTYPEKGASYDRGVPRFLRDAMRAEGGAVRPGYPPSKEFVGGFGGAGGGGLNIQKAMAEEAKIKQLSTPYAAEQTSGRFSRLSAPQITAEKADNRIAPVAAGALLAGTTETGDGDED